MQAAMGLAPVARLKFGGDGGFHAELKRRVQAYFSERGLSTHGGPPMYLKSAVMLVWLCASYALLVFAPLAWWQGVLASLSLVLAVAGIGFAVQHDATHGAYSNRASVNRAMGMTLDLVGASSYVWHWKHNVLHHTYPNVPGSDADIGVAPFGRLAPDQRHRFYYRLQPVYMWALYGFLFFKWHLVDDFLNVGQGRIERNRIPRPRGWRLFELLVGKAVFFGWALVVPMLFHSWWVVLLFYASASFLLGVVLAVVFQLAHCIEEASFPRISGGVDRVTDGWAAHQVHATVDFACRNRVLTWYLGGLNFQVEHHLFPRICHVHYPRIAGIVEQVCREYGVAYSAHERMGQALSSHWRWLRQMSRPEHAAVIV